MEIGVYSLGSGSKGNCVILSDGKTGVMIDAGLSPRATFAGLKEIGLGVDDLDGILLTHEHSDHVRSLPVLSAFLPVYSHEDTFAEAEKTCEGLNEDNLVHVDKPFTVGGFEVTPFVISHDAAHPYGFVIDNGHEKVGYVTDTGYISKGILKTVSGCDTVVMESNHDREMLLRGVYPERLKRRILSDRGHLCNEEAALTVCDLANNGTKRFLLAHVSENNNLTELAYWTTVRQLASKGAKEGDVTVKVALQREKVILS